MQKPFVIGLTGVSGAGKTTFLNKLKAAFNEQELSVVSQDNYYKPKEKQSLDDQGIQNFDLPSSLYREEFHQDISKLISGETVRRKEYTFNNKLAEPKMLEFQPRPLLLIEGIFIYHYAEINELLDLRLFLQVKETTAYGRRIRRDKLERNYPLDDVLYRFEKHVLPAYEKYIKPHMHEADLIINNNSDFNKGLDVVVAYLKDILNKG